MMCIPTGMRVRHATTIQALLAFAWLAGGTAQAQSSVRLYGLIDVGVVREGGGPQGTIDKVTSGVAAGSRWGLIGQEDLGGGMAVNFLLENGYQADTGALGQNALFGRQAYVGLSGRYGALTMGRQYTPHYASYGALLDPFEVGLPGQAKNLMAIAGARTNNSIKYITPLLHGYVAELIYGAGELEGNTKTGSAVGAALNYAAGPLNLRIAYHKRNNDTATVHGTSDSSNTLLAANYKIGIYKLFAGYGINRGLNSAALSAPNPFEAVVSPVPSTNSRDLLLGWSARFGLHTLLASHVRKDDRTRFNQDAHQSGVGYLYALSLRTDLYASYAAITNRNGAGYTVGSAIEAGSGNRATALGIRHKF
jgi:predicted porin